MTLMALKNIWSQIASIKTSYDARTSCRNLISIDHTTSDIFAVFCQLCSLEKRKSLDRAPFFQTWRYFVIQCFLNHFRIVFVPFQLSLALHFTKRNTLFRSGMFTAVKRSNYGLKRRTSSMNNYRKYFKFSCI